MHDHCLRLSRGTNAPEGQTRAKATFHIGFAARSQLSLMLAVSFMLEESPQASHMCFHALDRNSGAADLYRVRSASKCVGLRLRQWFCRQAHQVPLKCHEDVRRLMITSAQAKEPQVIVWPGRSSGGELLTYNTPTGTSSIRRQQ